MLTDEELLRQEFNNSSMYPPPKEFDDGSLFRIRNSYPQNFVSITEPAPWLDIDFKTEPERYLKLLKDYCFLGMPESDFDVHKNQVTFLLLSEFTDG